MSIAETRQIPSQYTRMVIVECISDEAAREVRNHMDAHVDGYDPKDDGFVSSQRLSEQDGRMVILEMTFDSLESAVRYGSGRDYRVTLVQKIQHFLVGDPVVKLFRRYSQTEARSAAA